MRTRRPLLQFPCRRTPNPSSAGAREIPPGRCNSRMPAIRFRLCARSLYAFGDASQRQVDRYSAASPRIDCQQPSRISIAGTIAARPTAPLNACHCVRSTPHVHYDSASSEEEPPVKRLGAAFAPRMRHVPCSLPRRLRNSLSERKPCND